MAMKKGTKVKIKGLVNAAIHNGKIGIVVKEQEVASSSSSSSSSSGGGGTTSRLGVKLLDSGKILAIKMENLEPITTTKTKTTTMTNKTVQKKKTPDNEISKQPKQQLCPTANAAADANAATMITPPLNNNNNEEPKQRTLKRDYGLLKEFDGNSYDPNVLVLYYHFADRAYDCFNGTEYITQMLRYYKNGITVKLILPRRIGANTYHIIGLQHPQHNKNTLCEVAFNCGRSFCGISMLIKNRCFACNKPNAIQCPKCLCVWFCPSQDCAQRNSMIHTEHNTLCSKVNVSKIVIEQDCIQLLD